MKSEGSQWSQMCQCAVATPVGRIIFELLKDDCPRTVENFRCLCTGEKGEGRTTYKPLHYKSTPIHRIVKGFIVQGGDFSSGDGTGGECIYGGMFKDENFKHKHERPFLLSMANKGPNTNGSQFFITTRPAPHLDGIHVVFGRVMSGSQFVVEIENQKVDVNHRPYADIRITHSGELVLLKKKKGKTKRESASVSASPDESSSSGSSESESESEDSEEERRKKRRLKRKKKAALKKKQKMKAEESLKKKKTKKKVKKKHKTTEHKHGGGKHSKKKHDSAGSESEESESENEHVTSTVPELAVSDLPEDIKSDRISWLHRRSRTPSPRGEKEKVAVEGHKGSGVGDAGSMTVTGGRRSSGDRWDAMSEDVTSRKHHAYKPLLFVRDNEVSHSGRILKGRGTMVYCTPPREEDDDDFRSRLHSDTRDRSEERSRNWTRHNSRYQRHRSHSRSRSRDWDRGDTYRGSRSHKETFARHRRGEGSPRFREERKTDRGLSDREEKGSEVKERKVRRSSRYDSQRSDSEEDRVNRRRQRRYSGRRHRRDKDSMSDESERKSRYNRKMSRSRSRSSSGGRGGRSHARKGRRQTIKSTSGEPVMTSKWARHRDQKSAEVSTSEEDRELERTFHQKRKRKKDKGGREREHEAPAEEDLFGLNKLLPVP